MKRLQIIIKEREQLLLPIKQIKQSSNCKQELYSCCCMTAARGGQQHVNEHCTQQQTLLFVSHPHHSFATGT
jgi:hypothetical protein